ncbi:MAG: hypothetical protein A2Y32_02965 [Spirochaetes bacterium GWF1_60_12]|nr:MAG: hypothetical protein A2Y32_02965 [Spirochaetes bacterium GWF1_60_12]
MRGIVKVVEKATGFFNNLLKPPAATKSAWILFQGALIPTRRFRWVVLLLLGSIHLLAQAEWPHISPGALNVGETCFLRPRIGDSAPTGRNFASQWPNRILFLVIHDNLVGLDGFGHVLVSFGQASAALASIAPQKTRCSRGMTAV